MENILASKASFFLHGECSLFTLLFVVTKKKIEIGLNHNFFFFLKKIGKLFSKLFLCIDATTTYPNKKLILLFIQANEPLY